MGASTWKGGGGPASAPDRYMEHQLVQAPEEAPAQSDRWPVFFGPLTRWCSWAPSFANYKLRVGAGAPVPYGPYAEKVRYAQDMPQDCQTWAPADRPAAAPASLRCGNERDLAGACAAP